MFATIRNFLYKKFLQFAPYILKHPIEEYVNNRLVLMPSEQLEKKFSEALSYLLKNKVKLGDYLEFGVYRGASMLSIYRALNKLTNKNVRLFGFDSFEGLPDIDNTIDKATPWLPGQFKSSYQNTKQIIDKAGVDWKRVFLIKGWFNKTLNKKLIQKYNIPKASVIMIDCDLYSSAKQALNFCAPLIKDKAIIFFDDWDAGENLAEKNLGEKRAFDEFLKDNSHLRVKEFGSYYHTEMKNSPIAKIFLLTNSRVKRSPSLL